MSTEFARAVPARTLAKARGRAIKTQPCYYYNSISKHRSRGTVDRVLPSRPMLSELSPSPPSICGHGVRREESKRCESNGRTARERERGGRRDRREKGIEQEGRRKKEKDEESGRTRLLLLVARVPRCFWLLASLLPLLSLLAQASEQATGG